MMFHTNASQNTDAFASIRNETDLPSTFDLYPVVFIESISVVALLLLTDALRSDKGVSRHAGMKIKKSLT